MKEIVGDDSSNDYLASTWEDKSFYEYVEITEDNTVTIYLVDGGSRSVVSSWSLNEIMEYLTLNGDELTLQEGSDTYILERTDEIPEFED